MVGLHVQCVLGWVRSGQTCEIKDKCPKTASQETAIKKIKNNENEA